MPSIRPNAMNNRQRQLEALQRQEELLRSKSQALAAKRLASAEGSSEKEVIPEFIETKNRMDVHVLDISCVLSGHTAKWKELSELQASNAPIETICCSLVEGRGELVLFGGVIREGTIPVTVNTAINKLYL